MLHILIVAMGMQPVVLLIQIFPTIIILHPYTIDNIVVNMLMSPIVNIE